MFCIKTSVFIVSDTIRPVALPREDYNSFVGVPALVSGFHFTPPGKCGDPFDL